MGQVANVDAADADESRSCAGGIRAIQLVVNTPSGDARVHARAADILADFVHDQQVEIPEGKLRTNLPRPGQQPRLFDFHLRRRHCFNARGLMSVVFQNGHAAQNLAASHIDARHFQQRFFKTHPQRAGMKSACALQIAQTDGGHLHDAALDLAVKVVCAFTRFTRSTRPASKPCLSMNTSMPDSVTPVSTVSMEDRTGTPMWASSIPYLASTACCASAVAPP